MSEKFEISDQELLEIDRKIQSQESTYRQEADKLGMDRTTLSKKVKALRQKLKGDSTMDTIQSTIEEKETDQEQEQQQNPPSIIEPTADETEKVTFTLSKKLIKALRFKAVNEDKKTIDVVREALQTYIEKKYFDTLI